MTSPVSAFLQNNNHYGSPMRDNQERVCDTNQFIETKVNTLDFSRVSINDTSH